MGDVIYVFIIFLLNCFWEIDSETRNGLCAVFKLGELDLM